MGWHIKCVNVNEINLKEVVHLKSKNNGDWNIPYT